MSTLFLKNRIKNLSGDKRRSPQLHLCRLCSSSPERRAVPGINRDQYKNHRSCWICQTGCSCPVQIWCRSFCSVNSCWCCFWKWYCARWLNLCGCLCYCCNFSSQHTSDNEEFLDYKLSMPKIMSNIHNCQIIVIAFFLNLLYNATCKKNLTFKVFFLQLITPY